MAKKITEFAFMELFDKFITETKTGKRLQKNGKRVSPGTIEQYLYLKKNLETFEREKKFPLRIKPVVLTNKRSFEAEKNYWKRFYRKFTGYLYDDLDCYDNYVGACFKTLRLFFNYLLETKGPAIGSFHKQFYVPKEDIHIIVLSPEQLNYLIYDKAFEEKLTPAMQTIKDVFVFGCTVALRFSDLMNLHLHNLEYLNDRCYLKVTSKKTQTPTKVLLPDYARDILKKYHKQQKTLLPVFSKDYLNKQVKRLAELADWQQPVMKTRNRRGIPENIYKTTKTRKAYRFCDLVTTHTMRRTAITTMLCLGMPEYMVRKISGHAAGSKEFFRYVELAQGYMDQEITEVFTKLTDKKMAALPA